MTSPLDARVISPLTAFSAHRTFSASPLMRISESRSVSRTPSSDSISFRFSSKEPKTLITFSILSTFTDTSVINALLRAE